MRTILLIAPKGLEVQLSNLLNPISIKKKKVENNNFLEFEFIGVIKCAHARLKNLGLLEHIKLISSCMGSYEKMY